MGNLPCPRLIKVRAGCENLWYSALRLRVMPYTQSDTTAGTTTSKGAGYYDGYHKKRGGKHCSACTFSHIEKLRGFFPCTKGAPVLDAGAGNCAFTRKLLEAGFDAH